MDHCVEKYVSLSAAVPGHPSLSETRVINTFPSLRQAIMCQGDMSLYTYKWLPEQDEPKVITGMQHICVDFNKIMEWAKERSFSIYDGLRQSPYRGEFLSSLFVLLKR